MADLFVVALSYLLALLFYVCTYARAQTTEIIFCLDEYQWMINSLDQNPCRVLAYLQAACLSDSTDSVVRPVNDTLSDTSFVDILSAFGTNWYYVKQHNSNDCLCNTVTYSVAGACGYCQGGSSQQWFNYGTNCTDIWFNSGFPGPIPPDTAIPAWAFIDVLSEDSFNVTAAHEIAKQGRSDSVASPTPTYAPTSVWALPTYNSQITAVSDISSSGPDGGFIGLIVGSVGGFLILITAFFFFLRRYLRARKRRLSKNVIQIIADEDEVDNVGSGSPRLSSSNPAVAEHDYSISPFLGIERELNARISADNKAYSADQNRRCNMAYGADVQRREEIEVQSPSIREKDSVPIPDELRRELEVIRLRIAELERAGVDVLPPGYVSDVDRPGSR